MSNSNPVKRYNVLPYFLITTSTSLCALPTSRLRNLPEVSSGGARPLHPITAGVTVTALTTPLTAAAYAAGVNIPNPTSTARRAPTTPLGAQPLGPVRARSAPGKFISENVPFFRHI